MAKLGTLHCFPTPLSQGVVRDYMAPGMIETMSGIDQWIVETHYEDCEEFDYHWDKKVFPAETREDVSDQTSTYRGKQWNIHPQAFLNEWKFKPFLQSKIDEVGLNIELTELCALWTVEYRKGGWQKAHRHSDQTVKKISAVCYLTEPDDDETTWHGGAFVEFDDEAQWRDEQYRNCNQPSLTACSLISSFDN